MPPRATLCPELFTAAAPAEEPKQIRVKPKQRASGPSIMQVQVETQRNINGDAEPVSFSIGARTLRVRVVEDRWLGRDHAYFKIEADDGARYILRHTAASDEWDMHWFSAG